MAHIGQIVEKVRSKNAGPFWLAIDIFCGNENSYDKVCNGLSSGRLAAALKADAAKIKRFDIPSLHVVKFSLPRPQLSLKWVDLKGKAQGLLSIWFQA